MRELWRHASYARCIVCMAGLLFVQNTETVCNNTCSSRFMLTCMLLQLLLQQSLYLPLQLWRHGHDHGHGIFILATHPEGIWTCMLLQLWRAWCCNCDVPGAATVTCLVLQLLLQLWRACRCNCEVPATATTWKCAHVGHGPCQSQSFHDVVYACVCVCATGPYIYIYMHVCICCLVWNVFTLTSFLPVWYVH